jgi:hypothetical protein
MKFEKYTPLIIVEFYLISTLIIFFFGPVSFRIHNLTLFIILMLMYHISFVAGYVVGALGGVRINFSKTNKSNKLFYVSLFFGVLGILNTYQNLMGSSSFIPWNIFQEVLNGIAEPGLIYSDRMNALALNLDSNSRFFNIISIFFAFFKLLFIFQFTYLWGQLSISKRIIAVFYSFLFLAPGIASGTNSVIFIFFIFVSSSVLVSVYLNRRDLMLRFGAILSILFLLPIYSFGFIMSQRGGGVEYFATTSTLGDIEANVAIDLISGSILDFFYYSYVWLVYYVTQGYYGFSLIIDLEHDWTFGFGSSAFLQRQFQMVTGYDISNITFQRKITSVWDESVQWHSFYGQLANDFSVPGLILLMFAIGFMFSRVWLSVLVNRSFFGAALLPIFIIMFIFFPANNQVFGYLDTFSYAVFITFFWLAEGRKLRLLR